MTTIKLLNPLVDQEGPFLCEFSQEIFYFAHNLFECSQRLIINIPDMDTRTETAKFLSDVQLTNFVVSSPDMN